MFSQKDCILTSRIFILAKDLRHIGCNSRLKVPEREDEIRKTDRAMQDTLALQDIAVLHNTAVPQ